ncbi:MAG: QueT transporter family protein [Intestinimonas sp.]
MRKFDAKQLTLAAVIAAACAALTLCLPAYGAIQVRLSEAFTVLPFLFPAAVPGVAVGCLVANLLQPLRAHRRGVRHRRTPCWPPCWTSRIRHRALAPLPRAVQRSHHRGHAGVV